LPRAWRFLLAGSLLLASCVRVEEPERRRFAADVRVPAADIYLPPETETIESTVPRHATLDSLLRAHHLQEQLVVEAIAVARDVFDPRHLRADQPYRLVRSLDGLLREFEYEIDADRFLRIISRDHARPDALDAQVVAYDKQTELAAIDARIDGDHTSLISSIDGAGEQIQLALELADIFSGQVDFHTELQPGDGFRVLFEKSSRDGQFSSYGAILGASIDVGGRRLQAIRWIDPSTGKAAYYDETGRSLKRFFLKSPLKFEPRVTSTFSTRRFHPIDHVYKAHLGVDYGAPTGSSVVAVANGVVVAAGYSGAGGNTVHLLHPGGFETYYLHLSAFGPGIHAGARVGQGQLIGRVGMTGSATGPHLDYRLKRNGAFVNPVAVHSRQAPGDPIPATELGAFKTSCDALLSRLSHTLLAEAPHQAPDAVHAK
jgi:murein DD-endopeptidase MepM/ murein hydrolase activator NlpD